MKMKEKPHLDLEEMKVKLLFGSERESEKEVKWEDEEEEKGKTEEKEKGENKEEEKRKKESVTDLHHVEEERKGEERKREEEVVGEEEKFVCDQEQVGPLSSVWVRTFQLSSL